MDNQNCNHSQRNRYRYKGFLVQVFLEADFERDAYGGTRKATIAYFKRHQSNCLTTKE